MNESLCATTIRHIKWISFIALLHKNVTIRVRYIDIKRRLQQNNEAIENCLVSHFYTGNGSASVTVEKRHLYFHLNGTFPFKYTFHKCITKYSYIIRYIIIDYFILLEISYPLLIHII